MVAPYLPIDDLARIYHVHQSTIKRWAREDRWRRTGTKPMRYHLGDAQDSYERRHGANRRAERIMTHLDGKYAPDPTRRAQM